MKELFQRKVEHTYIVEETSYIYTICILYVVLHILYIVNIVERKTQM